MRELTRADYIAALELGLAYVRANPFFSIPKVDRTFVENRPMRHLSTLQLIQIMQLEAMVRDAQTTGQKLTVGMARHRLGIQPAAMQVRPQVVSKPHQGEAEQARRLRQMARGQLKAANGLVAL